jgi:hypothetical protein
MKGLKYMDIEYVEELTLQEKIAGEVGEIY